MDRVEVSKEYAAACQSIVNTHGDDYKSACKLIANVSVPDGIHPMLTPIALFAYDVVEDFRGMEDNVHYWEVIKTKLTHFLAGDWEHTAWWAMVMYGFEEDAVLRRSYSLSIRRQGATMTYESGNEQLINTAKEIADSISQHQTDEWFIYSLLQKLPKKIDELTLQSTTIHEAAVPEWDAL